MFFYKVVSSHWPNTFEFKSNIKFEIGQCFKILSHNGSRHYPTRFKVIDISSVSEYAGEVINILSADTNVKPF